MSCQHPANNLNRSKPQPQPPPTTMMRAPLAQALLATLACVMVATHLPLGALACNSPGKVCRFADKQCQWCSYDHEACDDILCNTQVCVPRRVARACTRQPIGRHQTRLHELHAGPMPSHLLL